MLYVLLQLDEKKKLEEVEKQLEEMGVNSFSNYKEDESGIISLSRVKKYIIDISEYDDEEIEDEFNNRDL